MSVLSNRRQEKVLNDLVPNLPSIWLGWVMSYPGSGQRKCPSKAMKITEGTWVVPNKGMDTANIGNSVEKGRSGLGCSWFLYIWWGAGRPGRFSQLCCHDKKLDSRKGRQFSNTFEKQQSKPASSIHLSQTPTLEKHQAFPWASYIHSSRHHRLHNHIFWGASPEDTCQEVLLAGGHPRFAASLSGIIVIVITTTTLAEELVEGPAYGQPVSDL